jgi:hypothetical protein
VQRELNSGLRQTRRFERKSEIAVGRFYILGGQKAHVAAMDEPFSPTSTGMSTLVSA